MALALFIKCLGFLISSLWDLWHSNLPLFDRMNGTNSSGLSIGSSARKARWKWSLKIRASSLLPVCLFVIDICNRYPILHKPNNRKERDNTGLVFPHDPSRWCFVQVLLHILCSALCLFSLRSKTKSSSDSGIPLTIMIAWIVSSDSISMVLILCTMESSR